MADIKTKKKGIRLLGWLLIIFIGLPLLIGVVTFKSLDSSKVEEASSISALELTTEEDSFEIINKKDDSKTASFSCFFEENLVYDYELGFGTTDLTYPINLISGSLTSKKRDVEMKGNEPLSEMASPTSSTDIGFS